MRSIFLCRLLAGGCASEVTDGACRTPGLRYTGNAVVTGGPARGRRERRDPGRSGQKFLRRTLFLYRPSGRQKVREEVWRRARPASSTSVSLSDRPAAANGEERPMAHFVALASATASIAGAARRPLRRAVEPGALVNRDLRSLLEKAPERALPANMAARCG